MEQGEYNYHKTRRLGTKTTQSTVYSRVIAAYQAKPLTITR
jgi:hypothetical protein